MLTCSWKCNSCLNKLLRKASCLVLFADRRQLGSYNLPVSVLACRQEIINWEVPDPEYTDKKMKGPLAEKLFKKQDDYRRYVAAANASAGKGWDNMLGKILERDELASAIRKDDLYNLANLGMNDDWSVQAGMEIFARTPEEAEADGWERAGTAARVQLKSVAFVFDTMQEGMKILRAWGVLKEDKGKDKENNPSLEWNVKREGSP
jgi:hypothetical protein